MTKKPIISQTYNFIQPSPVNTVEQLLDSAVQNHQQGQLQLAEQQYKKILELQPKHDYVLNLLGILLSQFKGDHKQAEKLLKKAIKINPEEPDYHGNLGLCLQYQNKYPEAEKAYKKATRLNPNFINAWFGLGNVNLYLKNTNQAIKNLQKTIEIDPDFIPAYNNLGNIFRDSGQFDDAIMMFKKVLELKPDFAEAWYNLGLVYRFSFKGNEAISAFEKAIDIKKDYVRAICNKGICYYKLLDDSDNALKDFDKAIEIDADYIFPYLHKASIFQNLGRFEDAEKILRKAIEINELSISAYLALSDTKLINEKDTSKLQFILEEDKLGINQSVTIQFALGKIFNDSKEYDKAFQYYDAANKLFRKNYEYDIQNFKNEVLKIKQIFNKSFIQKNKGYGSDSELPVFIIGMPRSGTTLTEQIISSHPDVHGGGELHFLRSKLSELPGHSKDLDVFHDEISQINTREIKLLAENYLSEIEKLDSHASRVTDKLPHNFLCIGLIAILYPNARIIHCKRDPMANCLSIYFQLFEGMHPYAYNLKELGTYYKEYLTLMEHWDTVLPNRVFTINYEDLINNTETISKQLIEHIDLEWDECCLKYFENERIVSTASKWQVRQPIYNSSIDTWRHYVGHLDELKSALGT